MFILQNVVYKLSRILPDNLPVPEGLLTKSGDLIVFAEMAQHRRVQRS